VAAAADISGGSAQTGSLKGGPRLPSPKLAPASDDAAKAMAKFKLPAGFAASLWASEPMLGNPVAFDIDDQGRAFVAETFRYRTSTLDIRHYMFMLEDDLASRSTDDRIAFTKKSFPKDWPELEKETEVVRLVQDKDGDGRADASSEYAAGMNTLLDGINSGVLAYDGKVWCTNMPNLWAFSGLTAEGKAEKRESLSFGYGVRYSFTGHDMHGLALGPDGRLYFSFGDRGASVKTKEGRTLAFPDEGAVFRCEPDGSHLEVFYRGLRNPQELAFDDHGNLFTGDNDCDQGDRERWVYLVEGGDSGWRVGWQHPPLGKENNMWLTEKMWEPRNADTPAYMLAPILNIPDGPSGVVHYPGTGLPEEYRGAFFVCGFKGTSARSAISWWKIKPDGAGFAVEKSPATFVDNVQATDVAFGPDSRVYFTEWGEGWEGTGKGRIFRLDHAAVAQAQAAQIAEVKKLLGEGFKQRASAELAKLLGHADQRVRLRAQWALAEKADAAQQFAAAAKSGAGLARLHGIWGLGHVARLADYKTPGSAAKIVQPLGPLLTDKEAEVRAQVAKVLGEARVGVTELTKLLKDESARVRFFALQALAKTGGAVPAALEVLRSNDDQDQFLRHAGVMVLQGAPPAQLVALAKDPSRAVRLAAVLALRRSNDAGVAAFLADADTGVAKEAARAVLDGGIDAALPQLAKLIAKPVPDERTMFRVLGAAFRVGEVSALAKYAADAAQPEKLRTEALTLLGTFAQPMPRERVTGLYRPLPARDATVAARALESVVAHIGTAKNEKLLLALSEAAARLDAKGTADVLANIVQDAKAAPKARVAALEALAKLDVPQTTAALATAGSDSLPALKTAASKLLGARNPDSAAQQLIAAWNGADAVEKQGIATALGATNSTQAGAFLAKLVAALANEPAAARLEILEAAAQHEGAKAALAAYTAALPAADPVAKHLPALEGGDAVRGEALFKEHAVAQCLRCHKVNGSGGDAGPDLTGIGAKKDRRYLLEAIVNPNATIAEGFQTVMFTLANGDLKAGIVKSETADSITIQMPIPDAPSETFKKADVKARENAPSGMPPGMGELLSPRDLRDIVQYVAGLK
jgi:quinoprotein glucose dehydrogenase